MKFLKFVSGWLRRWKHRREAEKLSKRFVNRNMCRCDLTPIIVSDDGKIDKFTLSEAVEKSETIHPLHKITIDDREIERLRDVAERPPYSMSKADFIKMSQRLNAHEMCIDEFGGYDG